MRLLSKIAGVAAVVITSAVVMIPAASAAPAPAPAAAAAQITAQAPAAAHARTGGVSGLWWCSGGHACQYVLCDSLLGCGSVPLYTMGPGEPEYVTVLGHSFVINWGGASNSGLPSWYQNMINGAGAGSSSSNDGCSLLDRDNPCFEIK